MTKLPNTLTEALRLHPGWQETGETFVYPNAAAAVSGARGRFARVAQIALTTDPISSELNPHIWAEFLDILGQAPSDARTIRDVESNLWRGFDAQHTHADIVHALARARWTDCFRKAITRSFRQCTSSPLLPPPHVFAERLGLADITRNAASVDAFLQRWELGHLSSDELAISPGVFMNPQLDPNFGMVQALQAAGIEEKTYRALNALGQWNWKE